MNDLSGLISNEVFRVFLEYTVFASGIATGLVFAGIYQRFVSIRKVSKTYERLVDEKQKRIDELKQIICQDLDKIIVEKVHSRFFKRLRNSFKFSAK